MRDTSPLGAPRAAAAGPLHDCSDSGAASGPPRAPAGPTGSPATTQSELVSTSLQQLQFCKALEETQLQPNDESYDQMLGGELATCHDQREAAPLDEPEVVRLSLIPETFPMALSLIAPQPTVRLNTRRAKGHTATFPPVTITCPFSRTASSQSRPRCLLCADGRWCEDTLTDNQSLGPRVSRYSSALQGARPQRVSGYRVYAPKVR